MWPLVCIPARALCVVPLRWCASLSPPPPAQSLICFPVCPLPAWSGQSSHTAGTFSVPLLHSLRFTPFNTSLWSSACADLRGIPEDLAELCYFQHPSCGYISEVVFTFSYYTAHLRAYRSFSFDLDRWPIHPLVSGYILEINHLSSNYTLVQL